MVVAWLGRRRRRGMAGLYEEDYVGIGGAGRLAGGRVHVHAPRARGGSGLGRLGSRLPAERERRPRREGTEE
uniref:Uncharacterized protein n=1 Tax=Arundo donax TaxID=35708 RepID=A0A0A9GL49_ARUDO